LARSLEFKSIYSLVSVIYLLFSRLKTSGGAITKPGPVEILKPGAVKISKPREMSKPEEIFVSEPGHG